MPSHPCPGPSHLLDGTKGHACHQRLCGLREVPHLQTEEAPAEESGPVPPTSQGWDTLKMGGQVSRPRGHRRSGCRACPCVCASCAALRVCVSVLQPAQPPQAAPPVVGSCRWPHPHGWPSGAVQAGTRPHLHPFSGVLLGPCLPSRCAGQGGGALVSPPLLGLVSGSLAFRLGPQPLPAHRPGPGHSTPGTGFTTLPGSLSLGLPHPSSPLLSLLVLSGLLTRSHHRGSPPPPPRPGCTHLRPLHLLCLVPTSPRFHRPSLGLCSGVLSQSCC